VFIVSKVSLLFVSKIVDNGVVCLLIFRGHLVVVHLAGTTSTLILLYSMKNTPFTEKHIALGAKMAEFAGYNMPISYSGINEEHHAVRNNAGVFDVSHMGEFVLKGDGALDLIQRVTSNDASKLTDGKAQYSCLPNNEGGIVDDLLVYCLETNKSYMLVVNASNI